MFIFLRAFIAYWFVAAVCTILFSYSGIEVEHKMVIQIHTTNSIDVRIKAHYFCGMRLNGIEKKIKLVTFLNTLLEKDEVQTRVH